MLVSYFTINPKWSYPKTSEYNIPRVKFKGGYTLVTLPRIVTPYRDSVDETRDRVTYRKLVTP